MIFRRRGETGFGARGANIIKMHRREETFVHADHPLYAKFARLTQQEEKAGLLADPATIGTREGWVRRLSERGFA